jgi:hypothetical protein
VQEKPAAEKPVAVAALPESLKKRMGGTFGAAVGDLRRDVEQPAPQRSSHDEERGERSERSSKRNRNRGTR